VKKHTLIWYLPAQTMTSLAQPVNNRFKRTLDQINSAIDWTYILLFLENLNLPDLKISDEKCLQNIKFLMLQNLYDLSTTDLIEHTHDRYSFQCFLELRQNEPFENDEESLHFRDALKSKGEHLKVLDFIWESLNKNGIDVEKGYIKEINVKPVSHTNQAQSQSGLSQTPKPSPQFNYETIKQMIKGDINLQFKHYALQMQLHQAQKDIRSGSVSLDDAAQNLLELCKKILSNTPQAKQKSQGTNPKLNLETLKQMIQGEMKLQFKHYALKMQLHQAQKDVRTGKTNLDDAAQNLLELCQKVLAKKPKSKTAQPKQKNGASKLDLETLKQMIRGDLKQKFKHYALQMQLHQAQKDVRNGTCTLDSAAKKLLELSRKILSKKEVVENKKEALSKRQIPDIDRKEWRELIMGNINYEFKNYVLQVQLHQLRKDIRTGRLKVEEAIQDLYDLCSKFPIAVQTDFKHIFQTW